jgi:hypothetical protein
VTFGSAGRVTKSSRRPRVPAARSKSLLSVGADVRRLRSPWENRDSLPRLLQLRKSLNGLPSGRPTARKDREARGASSRRCRCGWGEPRSGKKRAVTFAGAARRQPLPATARRRVFSPSWGAGARVRSFLLALAAQGRSPRRTSPDSSNTLRADAHAHTQRNPILSLRLSGWLWLRSAQDRFARLSLFHDPPRNTRVGPDRRFRSRTSLAEILFVVRSAGFSLSECAPNCERRRAG